MSYTAVATNLQAMNAHRQLGMVGNKQSNASRRLASGFRVNSSADDAAGLAISEKKRGQIRSLEQNFNNVQDGVNLIQTAESALATINEMVIRIRELVIQASNDTNAHDYKNLSQSDRVQIQREINELVLEIDAVAQRTNFNTRTLLDGRLSRFERFVVETVIMPLLSPANLSTIMPVITSNYGDTIAQWLNFVDHPSLRASVTLNLDGIDLTAPAYQQLHGKSVIIAGHRFNFQDAANPILFPSGTAGTAISVPNDPTISTQDFLLSLSDPNPLVGSSTTTPPFQAPTPGAGGILAFRELVNEVIITPPGTVEFRSPLRVASPPQTIDWDGSPPGLWVHDTGENNNQIVSNPLPNLRMVNGAIGTENIQPISPIPPPTVNTSGDFEFTLRSVYTQADIDRLVGNGSSEPDPGFRIIAPGLAPDPFNVGFSLDGLPRLPGHPATIQVWPDMTGAQMQTQIMNFLNNLPLPAAPNRFNPITPANLDPGPVGGDGTYTLRINMQWNNTAALPSPQIQLRNSLLPGDSLPLNGWTEETSPTMAISGLGIGVSSATHFELQQDITTLTVPDTITLPTAFTIGGALLVFHAEGAPPPVAPASTQVYPNGVDASNAPEQTNRYETVPGGAVVSPIPTFIPIPDNADMQAFIMDTIVGRLSGFNDQMAGRTMVANTPEPGQISLFRPLPATPAVPVFAPAPMTIQHRRPAVPAYTGGNPTIRELPSTEIRSNRTENRVRSAVTHNVGFNIALANDGAGNINFGYTNGINHTGFSIGNHTFEFFVTNGGTPRRHLPNPTPGVSPTHIDLTAPMTPDEVRAAMEAAIRSAFPDKTSINVVENPANSGNMRINFEFTAPYVALDPPTSNLVAAPPPLPDPVPPGHGITVRNGNWQFQGLFTGEGTIGQFSGGRPAPPPSTGINFGMTNLLHLLPEGTPAQFRGFTYFCATCANEAFSIIFIDEEPPDYIPNTFNYNGIAVQTLFVRINIEETGTTMTGTQMANFIANALADEMTHLHTIEAVGSTLVISDKRNGNFPGSNQAPIGADTLPVYGHRNSERRGRIEPRVFTNFEVHRTKDIFEPDGIWIQKGPNLGQGLHVYIEAMTAAALGLADIRNNPTINVMKEYGFDIQPAIETLDEALSMATGQRTALGAIQNRLEFAAENVRVSEENLTIANSRIRDADMAVENMRLTQASILNQAALAMLAQANSTPNTVLQLLQS